MRHLLISIITITCILFNQVNAQSTSPPSYETNHRREIIKTKKYHPLYSNPDLNQEEISRIIRENELDERKVQVVRSSGKCDYTASEIEKIRANESEEDRIQRERAELERQKEDARSEPRADIGGNFRIPSNSDEAAVILLVVIGAVVIIYWLATVPALLAKMANDDGCVQSLKHFFFEYNGYYFSQAHQEAKSYALEFDFYFKHKIENSIYYGINAVLGSHSLQFAEGYELKQKHESTYFLIGPSLLFPFYSNEQTYGSAIHMDFLLGASQSEKIGSMAVGRIGFQHTTKEGLLWGFGVAGNKFSIDQNDSFYKFNSDVSLSTYFRLGISF